MEKEKNSEHIMSSEEGTENVKIRILESKLTSREEEVDRLDKEVDKLVNSRDSLQIEVDDLHEKLCIANHQIQELGKKVSIKF
jgi:peptidoglycan hydrolase CwlO-like protein